MTIHIDNVHIFGVINDCWGINEIGAKLIISINRWFDLWKNRFSLEDKSLVNANTKKLKHEIDLPNKSSQIEFEQFWPFRNNVLPLPRIVMIHINFRCRSNKIIHIESCEIVMITDFFCSFLLQVRNKDQFYLAHGELIKKWPGQLNWVVTQRYTTDIWSFEPRFLCYTSART